MVSYILITWCMNRPRPKVFEVSLENNFAFSASSWTILSGVSLYTGGHSGQQRAGALGREPDLHDAIQRHRWRRCAAPSAAASRLFKRRWSRGQPQQQYSTVALEHCGPTVQRNSTRVSTLLFRLEVHKFQVKGIIDNMFLLRLRRFISHY